MIRKERLFSTNIINIFTDASMDNNTKAGCSGAICVLGDRIIDKSLQVISNTTNNYCELYAIALGIDLALRYRYVYYPEYINLFSDSDISVLAIKEWIFKWINNVRYDKDSGYNVLYTSTNQKVKNQELVIMIVNTILNNNLNINIYHQNGHVKYTEQSIEKAKNHFANRNMIVNTMENELIEKLSYYNNEIDDLTRTYLFKSSLDERSNNHLAITQIYQPFNTDEYMKLINLI